MKHFLKSLWCDIAHHKHWREIRAKTISDGGEFYCSRCGVTRWPLSLDDEAW